MTTAFVDALPSRTERMMDELIARLEKATGPDRELDCLIGVAVGRFVAEPPKNDGDGIRYREGNNWPGQAGDMLVPHYTGSLDAALTLIPEGWHLVQLRHMSPTHWFAELGSIENDGLLVDAEAQTGPLAWCTAALKAHQP